MRAYAIPGSAVPSMSKVTKQVVIIMVELECLSVVNAGAPPLADPSLSIDAAGLANGMVALKWSS